MAKNVRPYREPTHAEITDRAHRIYEMAGRPEGKAMEHWLQAETELIAEHKAQAAQQSKVETKAGANSQAPRPEQPAPAARNSGWQPSRPPVTQN